MTAVIDAPSPNYNEREQPISLVIIHYTGMETGEEALERMRDPAAKVAAHYMIDESGQLYSLVPEEKRAWHAGLGGWADIDDVNGASIGIELVNKGHFWGYEDFPAAQMETLIELLKGIKARHHIPPQNVIGHSDVAPERKEDPGEKFPWNELAAHGLAVEAYPDSVPKIEATYVDSLNILMAIGYRFQPTHPVAAILAFQRRFVPSELGQGLSPKTRRAIAWAAERLK